MGDWAFTSTTSGAVTSKVTDAKSLTVSYGRFGMSVAFTACAGSSMTTVYPSGGDFAVASAPMLDPAPGLYSITTGWPRLLLISFAIGRPRTSELPPGG